MSATFVSGPVGTRTTSGSIRLGEEVGGVRVDGPRGRLGQLGAVEARLAVDVRRGAEVAPQRRLGAGGDRDVAPAGDLERDERVAGRLVERLVAGDGRDADQLDLRRGEREQDRDRVVVAGVAVDDDRCRAHSSASTSSAVGSEVWAPKRDAASAPAAHARRSDVVARPPLEQRDDEAGGERVAGRGAVDGLDRGRLRPRHLLPVLEENRALGAERETDESRPFAERLELEAVHDGDLGLGSAVARRARR